MSKQTFDFSEALKRMKQGKLVKRQGSFYSYGIDEEGIYFHYGRRFYDESRMSTVDILATDWEEVEE